MLGLDTINPILSNNKNVQDITKIIYEPLVNLTSDYKAEPILATEWAKQSDNSYLIKLRENVKWSSGERFTSEDVQFTIDRLKESSSMYSYNVQNVTGIDIIDDFTVKINLDREVPFFEYYLTFPILSKEYYEGEDFFNTEKNYAPITTGKYKIDSAESSNIVLKQNTSWWGAKKTKLTLETITINLYSSIGELYNSFKIGNLDVVATDNTNLSNYIGTIGYTAKEMKGRNHTFLAFNTQNELLSNIELRKAISYSIDKENIVSTAIGGQGFVSSFPLDYGSWLAKNVDVSSGYNATQTREILENSGWTLKSGIWQRNFNGRFQKTELNLLVKYSDETKRQIAENIKAQLAPQGILINVIQASDEDYANRINNKNYDIALCTVTLSTTPDLTTFFGNGNLANYQNDEVISIMQEVKNTTDEEALKEKFARLMEINKSEIPYLSLYNNKYTVAYNSGIAGNMTPNWINSFYGIESWYK